MSRLLFILLFISFVPVEAFSIIAESYLDENPAQVCKLVAYQHRWEGNERVPVKYSCSSTIIGNDRILTSQHCLPYERLDEARIICPNEEIIGVKATFQFMDRAQDLGIVVIDGEFKTEPVEILMDDDKYEQIKNNHFNNCTISGYGIDNDGKHGVLKSANVIEIEPRLLKLANPLEFSSDEGHKMALMINVASHGDSGGPLLCEINNKKFLSGVIRGIQNQNELYSDTELLNYNYPWYRYITSKIKPLDNEWFNKVNYSEKMLTELKNICKDFKTIKQLQILETKSLTAIKAGPSKLTDLEKINGQLLNIWLEATD